MTKIIIAQEEEFVKGVFSILLIGHYGPLRCPGSEEKVDGPLGRGWWLKWLLGLTGLRPEGSQV